MKNVHYYLQILLKFDQQYHLVIQQTNPDTLISFSNLLCRNLQQVSEYGHSFTSL
jgi:hypothetical protein